MQKIVPCLWFDKEAKDAAELYVATFWNSHIDSVTTITNTPSGDTDILSVNLMGLDFTLMNAGPEFKFNPSISFLVGCRNRSDVDAIWSKLSPKGRVLKELGEYPFSERYGWLQDKFGLSWQIMHMGTIDMDQRIVPTFMFVGNQCGTAEEAIHYYTKIFKNSSVESILRYKPENPTDPDNCVARAGFVLENQQFSAMDDSDYSFSFNEAISFQVKCESQEEIDYYWNKLSADPKSEQCGWLKDKYGVSWQIEPTVLAQLLQDKDPLKVSRVTETFLAMKKLEIKNLIRAFEGKLE